MARMSEVEIWWCHCALHFSALLSRRLDQITAFCSLLGCVPSISCSTGLLVLDLALRMGVKRQKHGVYAGRNIQMELIQTTVVYHMIISQCTWI